MAHHFFKAHSEDIGDGLGVQPLPLAGKAFDPSHIYADNGLYTVTVTVADNDIRAKADGYVDGNPKNDWIRVSAAQQEICLMVDDLIAYLETM